MGMDDRTIGSMFTGIGGLESAMGLPVSWHAEIGQATSRVLKRRWPDVPNLGDVTSIEWRKAPRPDVLLAGFPCQGNSVAGRRRGRADERWLWPHVATAVRALQPGEIMIENVPNLLRVDGGEAFGDILFDLAEAGYAARWTVAGACATGLAHHRHRLFIRALPASGCRPPSRRRWPMAGVLAGGEVYALPHPKCGAPPRGSAPPLLPTPTARDGDGRGEGSTEYWATHPRTSGIPRGAAVALLPTPTAADGSGRGVGNGGAYRSESDGSIRTRGIPLDAAMALLPTPRASDDAKGGPNQRGSSGDVALPAAVQPERFGRYAAAVARHARTVCALPPEPTEPNRNGNARLSARFVEWLMDYPDGWVTRELGRLEAITALGNAVVPRQCAYAYTLLSEPLA